MLRMLAQLETGLPQVSASESTVETAFTITLTVAGAICVLIITIAGLQYILSQGDPQQTAKAKGAILYAIIGLVVVMFAFAITKFVLTEI